MTEIGESLIRGMQQAIEHAKGMVEHRVAVPDVVPVKEIRNLPKDDPATSAGIWTL